MRVRGIVWTGIQTERFDEMSTLLQALFDGPPPIAEPGFSLWSLGNGDLVELFAMGTKPPFERAPVVGFQVDDLDEATRAIQAAGAEIVGGYGPNDAGYQSVHFRAPDGNIYELVLDPDHDIRATGHGPGQPTG